MKLSEKVKKNAGLNEQEYHKKMEFKNAKRKFDFLFTSIKKIIKTTDELLDSADVTFGGTDYYGTAREQLEDIISLEEKILDKLAKFKVLFRL